ncbi:5-formyltetrahydrofolate cyclo-ligase, mitochondrial [Castilleja foliolosa]|uniref:5-formyltetrahydrofolate cyclo-ligase n=1 Tax=Castilleja foliolosa TaxID=1961234 RepID=A0ABD3DB22_9LAMI
MMFPSEMTIMGLLQRLVLRIPPNFIQTTASPPPSTTGIPFLRSSTTMSASSTAATPLDTLFNQKKSLRFKVKKELKSMDPVLRSQEDEAIQRIVLESPWFKSCSRLCAYISCSALREVDTYKVLSEILKAVRKKLYVPRVEDKNSFMRMLNISRIDDLIANSMDILEPAPCDAEGNEREDVMFASGPVDLFILPGLAFDKSGRRLGRGGGYYDTFLTKYQELARDQQWKKPLFVALSYSSQIVEDGVIPITPNDVFIDALVSPSGVIPITQAANEMYV